MNFNAQDFISKLVSFRSVSADSQCAGELKKCAQFLNETFLSLGFESEIVCTPLHPVVFAKKNCKSQNPKVRVLCYGHYDVQPPEPLSKWKTPPFEASVKNGKIFGRGSADNKGPFTCILAGFLDFASKNPDAEMDIAFMLEGEEEIGSPSMADFLRDRAELLKGYDFVALSDTSSASLEQIVITTGIRGVAAFDAVFKGPNTDLHSGIFGGAVYNPIRAMAKVCASLHNDDGFVNVEGFYDGMLPATDAEREQIAKNHFNDEAVKNTLELKALMKQKGYSAAEAVRLLPSLEFTGISGGYEGEGNKSVIPSECFCKISCRSVSDQNMEKMVSAVKKTIVERCPEGVDVSFIEHGECGNAYFVQVPQLRDECSAPLKDCESEKLSKAFFAMESAVKNNFGKAPLFLREGGSIPLVSDIKLLTGLDCIMLGLFTPEDNLHAPNESFYLEMMEKAIKAYSNFFETISK